MKITQSAIRRTSRRYNGEVVRPEARFMARRLV